ncbi:hypothetical protein [Rhodothalassium salexigens]|uniref:hypothetical protein n=1 Tax=Rhodothalassium salexigens TaxID=1086 RepID=UPI001911C922|nr:hypothetical protein [Rhodothalassium salexigens]
MAGASNRLQVLGASLALLALAGCAGAPHSDPGAPLVAAGPAVDGVQSGHGAGAIAYVTDTGAHSYTLRAAEPAAAAGAAQPFYYVVDDTGAPAGPMSAAPGSAALVPGLAAAPAASARFQGTRIAGDRVTVFPNQAFATPLVTPFAQHQALGYRGWGRPGWRRHGVGYGALVPYAVTTPGVPLEYNTGQVDSPTGRLVFGSHNLADQGIRGGGFDAHLPPPQVHLGYGVVPIAPLWGY